MARQIDKLSAAKVSKLKRPGRHIDGGGLYLQVTRAGAKSWLFQYTAPNGKVRQMELGSLHTHGLAKARDLAKEARELVWQGIDPIDARDEKKLAARAEQAKHVTFREMAEKYIADRRDTWKAAKHAGQWSASLQLHVFPIIGDLPVTAINQTSCSRSSNRFGR